MGWRGIVAAGAVVLAACTPGGSAAFPSSSTTAAVPRSSTTDGSPSRQAGGCAVGLEPLRSVDWTEGPSAEVVVLAETGPRVAAALYPLPDRPARLWSQWGQGAVWSDGRFLSAVGDHRGADGNSYIYEFDPATGVLTLVADVLSLADHVPGAWGYGKIHAPMVRAGCGRLYTTTFWGTRRGLVYGQGYRGDLLLRIDPDARTVDNLGVLAEERGVPSLAASPDGSTLFAEAVDPSSGDGELVTVDLESGDRASYRIPGHRTFRSIAVDVAGDAYVATGDARLAELTPAGDILTVGGLPGAVLRAATAPGPDGSLVGATNDPAAFFRLRPDGSIDPLGVAAGYTTSLARLGDTVYSMPLAHGAAWTLGAPVVALDVNTGRTETVVELEPLVEEAFGLRVGGTYSVAVDPDARRLFLGLNASTLDDDSGFGRVLLVVVDLDR